MTIAGKKYCEGFKSGKVETHEVLIGEDAVPDGKYH